jgi:hypothetical protein
VLVPVLTHLMNADDVRMVQAGRRFSLAVEPADFTLAGQAPQPGSSSAPPTDPG